MNETSVLSNGPQNIDEECGNGTKNDEGTVSVLGRERRKKDALKKYDDYVVYVNFVSANAPDNFEEAMQGLDSVNWRKVMKEEVSTIESYRTW